MMWDVVAKRDYVYLMVEHHRVPIAKKRIVEFATKEEVEAWADAEFAAWKAKPHVFAYPCGCVVQSCGKHSWNKEGKP